MNIFMLGHSGVGKTALMASMYLDLAAGVNEFTLKAPTAEDQRLRRVARGITSGRWPLGTDRRSVYDFTLCYEGEDCFPFRWTDYRGDALTARSTSQEARDLKDDLANSTGILLFCAGDAVRHDRTAARREIHRMTYLVGQALTDLNRRVALGIIFTKMDLVDELDDELVEAFEGLVRAANANPLVNGTIIPVACGPCRANTPLPVLFALHIGINSELERGAAAIDVHRQEYERCQDRLISWDNLGRWMSGQKTYGTRAEDALRQGRAQVEKFLPLVEPAEMLDQYLEGLFRF